ncbi:MAG TPA: hypothetical protein VLY03_06820 [Bacteroidota bacterium]|nr:hypothetical protein [Bacteroidota bacterium]
MAKGPTKQNKNLKHVLFALFEATLTIGTGIYFYVAKGKEDVGLILGLLGVYFVVNRVISHFMTEEMFKDTENKIAQISKTIDIRNDSNVDLISKTLDIYLKISEPEFAAVKDKILNDAIDKLTKLNNDKHSDELVTSEYYHWLLPILESVGRGQSIKAVSCMFSAEWDGSPEEERFINGNLDAARKGATVERIFVMKRELINSALDIDAVRKHTKEQRTTTKLQGFFADKDKIDHNLMTTIGHGFIIFNSRFALVDKFDANGKVRGVVTMKKNEITEMEEAFARLKNISQDLSSSLKIQHRHSVSGSPGKS